jgi:hypothetical protein
MNVENGGRIELRLGSSTNESAEYEAQLETSGQSYQASIQVGASIPKQVDFGAWSPAEPPAWLVEDARAALKAALRTSQSEGRWPRRITRWRPEPTP